MEGRYAFYLLSSSLYYNRILSIHEMFVHARDTRVRIEIKSNISNIMFIKKKSFPLGRFMFRLVIESFCNSRAQLLERKKVTPFHIT